MKISVKKSKNKEKLDKLRKETYPFQIHKNMILCKEKLKVFKGSLIKFIY